MSVLLAQFQCQQHLSTPGVQIPCGLQGCWGSWILRSPLGCTHSTWRADSTARERGKLWMWCLAKGLPSYRQPHWEKTGGERKPRHWLVLSSSWESVQINRRCDHRGLNSFFIMVMKHGCEAQKMQETKVFRAFTWYGTTSRDSLGLANERLNVQSALLSTEKAQGG